jgi:hypothetical protein
MSTEIYLLIALIKCTLESQSSERQALGIGGTQSAPSPHHTELKGKHQSELGASELQSMKFTNCLCLRVRSEHAYPV